MHLAWADEGTAARLAAAVGSQHVLAQAQRLAALGESAEDFWLFEQVLLSCPAADASTSWLLLIRRPAEADCWRSCCGTR